MATSPKAKPDPAPEPEAPEAPTAPETAPAAPETPSEAPEAPESRPDDVRVYEHKDGHTQGAYVGSELDKLLASDAEPNWSAA